MRPFTHQTQNDVRAEQVLFMRNVNKSESKESLKYQYKSVGLKESNFLHQDWSKHASRCSKKVSFHRCDCEKSIIIVIDGSKDFVSHLDKEAVGD